MNDVFISYRRKNGEAWASLVKGLLERRGVRCYLDKHKKRTRDFKEALLRNIETSSNFLLILSENVFEKRDDDNDWVRDEIAYAKKHGVNVIPVMFNGYDPSAVNWNEEPEGIRFLETRESLKFDDTNLNLRDASITTIIEYMVDERGNPWKFGAKDNNGWYGDEISEEDRLWMVTSYDVCRKMDGAALAEIVKNPIFRDYEKIHYFSFMAYDIDSIAKWIDSASQKKAERTFDVETFGLCHKPDLAAAEEAFGKGHFLEFTHESIFEKQVEKLLRDNHLDYFDIVDMTLVLKDCQSPEKVMRKMVRYLNPKGAAIYIRDLDDDLVMAYPDDKGLIDKLVSFLSLDPGAGNRHFGKRIFTLLHKSGADEVRMIDSVVSTANVKIATRRKICDAYFSYLIPEFAQLVKQHPENEDYADAKAWLEQYYDDVEGLFESKEFYFRAGFIGGFGIYQDEDYL